MSSVEAEAAPGDEAVDDTDAGDISAAVIGDDGVRDDVDAVTTVSILLLIDC